MARVIVFIFVHRIFVFGVFITLQFSMKKDHDNIQCFIISLGKQFLAKNGEQLKYKTHGLKWSNN